MKIRTPPGGSEVQALLVCNEEMIWTSLFDDKGMGVLHLAVYIVQN